MKWSILICTVEGREWYLKRLIDNLNSQKGDLPIEILTEKDNGTMSIGAKRNKLMDMAQGEYTCFFDDDDEPSPIYVRKNWEGILKNVDCCSLTGLYYHNGLVDRPFLHSVKYKDWYSDDKFHYRCPNHLNAIKKDLVKHIRFKEINFGEDGQWSIEIMKQGLLNREYEIKEVIYHYYHRDK